MIFERWCDVATLRCIWLHGYSRVRVSQGKSFVFSHVSKRSWVRFPPSITLESNARHRLRQRVDRPELRYFVSDSISISALIDITSQRGSAWKCYAWEYTMSNELNKNARICEYTFIDLSINLNRILIVCYPSRRTRSSHRQWCRNEIKTAADKNVDMNAKYNAQFWPLNNIIVLILLPDWHYKFSTPWFVVGVLWHRFGAVSARVPRAKPSCR